MKFLKCFFAALCVPWFVSGCGGGGHGGDIAAVEPPWARGTLLQSPPVRTASFTAATLLLRLSAGSARDVALLELTGMPLCGVDVQSTNTPRSALWRNIRRRPRRIAAVLPLGGADFFCRFLAAPSKLFNRQKNQE